MCNDREGKGVEETSDSTLINYQFHQRNQPTSPIT